MMDKIGLLIGESRKKLALTQDQFGRRYSVSGPAIFKFEKGYVKPSLDLWLRMAKDIKIEEPKAVLMWVRAKLPKKFQDFIALEPAAAREEVRKYKAKTAKAKKGQTPEAVRKAIVSDRSAPMGLKQLLRDNDIWVLYKPKAKEMQVLRDVFGQLGDGSKSSYREALRLVREFTQ